MSFGWSAATWLAVSASVGAVGTVAGIVQNKQAQKAQGAANAQAQANAKKTQQMADEANNKASAKSPDITALAAANSQAGGNGSTMLTGPSGVDPSTLTLGKNSLLGG